jgi:hypothetical protein
MEATKHTKRGLMSLDANKSTNKMPRAVADGKITMGDIEIDCAVLEDGTQVINQASMLRLMGRKKIPTTFTKEIIALREGGMQIPAFVAANNLIPFISKHLNAGSAPIKFIHPKYGKANGYRADIIPTIIKTYLGARIAGVLTKDQLPIASTLEIVSLGLVHVGIAALVNEACGIPSSDKDFLQNILSKFIAHELQPWTRRFPPHFFASYKRMYNLSEDDSLPLHVGTFINHKVYKELAPGILEELKKVNPKDEDGKRAHAHHQFLTPNKGVVELEKQLIKVCTIMNLSDNRKDFDDKYKKSKELTLT